MNFAAGANLILRLIVIVGGNGLSRNDSVEMGSTAAPAVVRRALAPNAGAPGRTKRFDILTRKSGSRGRDPLRPGRARSPNQLHRSG